MSAFWSWRLQSNRVGQKIGLKPKMILNKVSFRELDKQRRTLESLALGIEEHKKKQTKRKKRKEEKTSCKLRTSTSLTLISYQGKSLYTTVNRELRTKELNGRNEEQLYQLATDGATKGGSHIWATMNPGKFLRFKHKFTP